MAEAMRHPTAGHPLHSLSCPESGPHLSVQAAHGKVPLVLVQLSHSGTIPDLCYFSWDGSLVYIQVEGAVLTSSGLELPGFWVWLSEGQGRNGLHMVCHGEDISALPPGSIFKAKLG